jgi:hypothetical protein
MAMGGVLDLQSVGPYHALLVLEGRGMEAEWETINQYGGFV